MYKNEFSNLLRSNKELPNNLMFFGEDEYFIEEFTKEILSRYNNPSILRLYHYEFNLETAKTHLAESSLFGDENILIVKTDKKIDTKSLKTLIEAANRNPNASFILHYFADDGKVKSKLFSQKSGGLFVRFFKPNFSEGMGVLSEIAKEKNISITSDILSHILSKHSLNIPLAISDLTKFELYQDHLSLNEASKLISGEEEADVLDLAEVIILKKDFTRVVAKVLLSGESEVSVITALSGFFTQLFSFHLGAKIEGAMNCVGILGYQLPPQILQKRGALANKISLQKYLEILKHLLRSELLLKTNPRIEKKAILLSTLIKIQELI